MHALVMSRNAGRTGPELVPRVGFSPTSAARSAALGRLSELGQALAGASAFRDINQRMHNKVLLVDEAVS